jgi:hypothetical protein
MQTVGVYSSKVRRLRGQGCAKTKDRKTAGQCYSEQVFGLKRATVAVALLSGPMMAQRATVKQDTANVYASADASSSVIGELKQGDAVVIEFRVTSGIAWCSVRRTKPAPLAGYVECSKLQAAEPASPTAFRQESSPVINEILRVSGFEGYLRHFMNPSMLEDALRRDQRTAGEAQQLMDAFARTMRPEVFLNPVRAALQQGYTEQLAAASLEWYRSDSGRRIAALENAAVTTASPDEFRNFARQLRTQPPPAARAALVNRLYRVADFSDLQIELAISVARSVGELLNPRLPPEKRLTEERLEKLSTQIRQLQPMLADLAKTRMLYIYRGLSDGELEQYVQFWETPHGRWLRSGMYKGSAEGVRDFALELAKVLIEQEDRRRR